MIKVYLAHPLSTTGEFNDSIRVARRIEQLHNDGEQKFEVYAPALNKEINDKSNNPTPEMIYTQDVDNLLDADVVVINYTGGDTDGTLLELGMLAGMHAMVDVMSVAHKEMVNDHEKAKQFSKNVEANTGVALKRLDAQKVLGNATNLSFSEALRKLPTVYVYSSNKRALQPQLHNGIASGKLNHMVLGAIDKHFVWCGTEDKLMQVLATL